MNITTRVFLESEVFGCEYFDPPDDGDLFTQFKRVCQSAEGQTRSDGFTRRVGLEIADARNYDEEVDNESRVLPPAG